MKVVNNNKRNFSRIHFDQQVNLDFFNERYDCCQIQDLNLTGMFIQGSFPQYIGMHCLVNLVQDGKTTALRLEAAGKIVRKNNEGLGIEFTAMTFECYMFLQAILLYEADEPLDIGLELPENCPYSIIGQPEEYTEQYKLFEELTLYYK